MHEGFVGGRVSLGAAAISKTTATKRRRAMSADGVKDMEDELTEDIHSWAAELGLSIEV